jgi:hypothetical protein
VAYSSSSFEATAAGAGADFGAGALVAARPRGAADFLAGARFVAFLAVRFVVAAARFFAGARLAAVFFAGARLAAVFFAAAFFAGFLAAFVAFVAAGLVAFLVAFFAGFFAVFFAAI